MFMYSLPDMPVWMAGVSDCVPSKIWGLQTIVNNL